MSAEFNNRDEIVKFFFYFSRFEYALKREKYIQNFKYIKPDWDRFFKENKTQIEVILKDQDLTYLLGHPPKKQIMTKDNDLGWENLSLTDSDLPDSIKKVLTTIRNNLFHGGKFPTGPESDVTRNKKLIEDALKVLNSLSQIEQIKKHFDEFFSSQ